MFATMFAVTTAYKWSFDIVSAFLQPVKLTQLFHALFLQKHDLIYTSCNPRSLLFFHAKAVTPGANLPNRVPRTQMSNRASLNRIRVPYSCSCDKSKAPYTIGAFAAFAG